MKRIEYLDEKINAALVRGHSSVTVSFDALEKCEADEIRAWLDEVGFSSYKFVDTSFVYDTTELRINLYD